MWPARVIFVLVVVYWSIVAFKAIDLKRRTHQSANAWPTHPFERILIVAWGVDITIWIGVPELLLAGFRSAWLTPLLVSDSMAMVGAVLAVTAVTASIVAWRQMGDAWRLGTNETETTSLVTSGIFGRIRHPIYAAQWLLLAASVMMLPCPPYLLLAIVHSWCIYRKVLIEEQYLLQNHGETYRLHEKQVPRFWPRRGGG